MAINPEELETRFTYHPPKAGQETYYEDIRSMAMDFATHLIEVVPQSRELSLAIIHIEDAVMWANAGLARRS